MSQTPLAVEVFAFVGIVTTLATGFILVAAAAHWIRYRLEKRHDRYVPAEWVAEERARRNCDRHPSRWEGRP